MKLKNTLFFVLLTAFSLLCVISGWLLVSERSMILYNIMEKPLVTITTPLFLILWYSIYLITAYAFYLVVKKENFSIKPKISGLFLSQLMLGSAWIPVFFNFGSFVPSTVIIISLLALFYYIFYSIYKIYKPVSFLILPAILVTSFAIGINITFSMLN